MVGAQFDPQSRGSTLFGPVFAYKPSYGIYGSVQIRIEECGVAFSEWFMPENAHLSGSIDEIELGFVEREVTPRLLMKLGIQLRLAGLSLLNTVSILELVGVERVRSTVHNRVHKADLQPESGQSLDYVVIDESVIQLGDECYWLYAAVDPGSNVLLHTKLVPVRTNGFAHEFLTSLREKQMSTTPSFSSMERRHSIMRVLGTVSI